MSRQVDKDYVVWNQCRLLFGYRNRGKQMKVEIIVLSKIKRTSEEKYVAHTQIVC